MSLDLTACVREPFLWVLLTQSYRGWTVRLHRGKKPNRLLGPLSLTSALTVANSLAEQHNAPVVHGEDVYAYSVMVTRGMIK